MMVMNKVRKIYHRGFIIALKEAIPNLRIMYEEGGSFIDDDYLWLVNEYIHVEDWLALIGFIGWKLGIKNADYLYSEYLEGMDV